MLLNFSKGFITVIDDINVRIGRNAMRENERERESEREGKWRAKTFKKYQLDTNGKEAFDEIRSAKNPTDIDLQFYQYIQLKGFIRIRWIHSKYCYS